MAVSMIGILILAGAVLGVLALLGMILANKQTRLFGVLLVGFGTMALLLLSSWLVNHASSPMSSPIEDPLHAVAVATAEDEFLVRVEPRPATVVIDQISQPRIDLSESVKEDEPGDADTAVAEGPTGDRPAWIDNPPKRDGGRFTSVVKVGPYSQLDECYEETDRQLASLAFDYLKSNAPAAVEGYGGASSPWFFGMTGASLRELLYRDEFVEPVDSSVGDMQNLYTLVEITPEDGERLRQSRESHEQLRLRDDRAARVTVVAGAVLGLVALAFGLLKLDEATRGYYSKRLLIGVPAAILGVIALLLATLA